MSLASHTLTRAELPAWPLAWLLIGFPIWWLLGLGEFSWTLFGAVMGFYILWYGRRDVPKGFGIILAFLLWAGLSVIAIDTFGRVLGFSFRYTQYAATAIAFVYVYNARTRLPIDRALGYLVVFWCWVILGGYLGLLFPEAVIHTPLAQIMPQSLLANDLVKEMTVRHLTQFNPNAWNYIAPRPSAPFLYTNNWGNAYSLLLPLVVLYISRNWATARAIAASIAIPISLVPALLTLNRGMFLGLGVVALYLAGRLALQARFRPLAWLGAIALIAALAAFFLPVADRLENRLEVSGTNAARTSVYAETIARTATAPFFGYGAPRPAETTGWDLPPAGTQGQVWMVMFSHGFLGVALFLAILAWFVLYAIRLSDLTGLLLGSVLVATAVEVFYYGVLGAGLYITFIVAALAMRTDQPSQVSLQSTQASIERYRRNVHAAD